MFPCSPLRHDYVDAMIRTLAVHGSITHLVEIIFVGNEGARCSLVRSYVFVRGRVTYKYALKFIDTHATSSTVNTCCSRLDLYFYQLMVQELYSTFHCVVNS